MGKHYTHLSRDERVRIEVLLEEGKSLSQIAKQLGRNKATISREVRRNGSPERSEYTVPWVDIKARRRRYRASRRPRLKTERIVLYMREKLREGWSPAQISGRIGIDHKGLSISHEAIYQYIYSLGRQKCKEFTAYLRCAHKRRKQKGQRKSGRHPKILNRVLIEQRPAHIETRQEFGHWEGDTLVSKKSTVALHTMVERKSRLLLISKLASRSSQDLRCSVVARLQGFPPHCRQTMTMDNGTENAQHLEITASLGMQCYFTRPYSAWQRGTNENLNAQVRWYLPKGTDFRKISDETIAVIEALINNRPRKCLGFRTPIEIAAQCVALRD